MLDVKSLRSEPFLWIHLSGIVMFPVCLGIMWIALGQSSPHNAPVVELSLLASIGILPILLMQLTRPFNIFSILLVSLKVESLSEQQKVILSLFKTFKQSLMSLIASALMMLTLWLVYSLSPLSIGAMGAINFVPQWRVLDLAIACIAFWASNLFLQVPLSVLLVLLTKQTKLTRAKPYAIDKIEQGFTTPGIQVNRIFWFLEQPSEITEKV